MATSSISTAKINLKSLLDDLWSNKNFTDDTLKKSFFEAVNESTFDNTKNEDQSIVLNTFILFTEYIKVKVNNGRTVKSNLSDTQTKLKDTLDKYFDETSVDNNEIKKIVDDSFEPTSTATPSAAATAATGIPSATSASYEKIWIKIFTPPGSVNKPSSVTGTTLDDNQLESIFHAIYVGKNQGKNGSELTQYLQGIRKFFKTLYNIPDSALIEDEWINIAKGLLQVATIKGIKNRKERESLNSQIKSKQYEYTLKYIKYKLQSVIANTQENKNKLNKEAKSVSEPAYNRMVQSEKRTLNSIINSIQNQISSKNMQIKQQKQKVETAKAEKEAAAAAATTTTPTIAATTATPTATITPTVNNIQPYEKQSFNTEYEILNKKEPKKPDVKDIFQNIFEKKETKIELENKKHSIKLEEKKEDPYQANFITANMLKEIRYQFINANKKKNGQKKQI